MLDLQIICTSPNNEVNRNIIEKSIKEEIKKNKDYYYYKSLGIYNFHNLLNNSVFIIGNPPKAETTSTGWPFSHKFLSVLSKKERILASL